MTLEGDLGIDSIKRVEILSEMQERAPGLPEVDAAAMAKLQTLQEIIEHLAVDSASSPGSRPTAGLPETPIVLEAVADSALNLQGLLLSVVAEKTGYPAEALELCARARRVRRCGGGVVITGGSAYASGALSGRRGRRARCCC